MWEGHHTRRINAPNQGLHSTRLSSLEIDDHTHFQSVLWQRFFPATAARVKPGRWAKRKETP